MDYVDDKFLVGSDYEVEKLLQLTLGNGKENISICKDELSVTIKLLKECLNIVA